MWRKFILLILIALLLFVDQETKSLARENLRGQSPRHFGVLTLIYAENTGAFLSIGSNLPQRLRAAIFDGIVTIALAVAAIALFRGRMQSRGDEVALALIIAGGVGNLIDRFRFTGRVTDFLFLSAGPLHTGVFNIADMAITFGVIWLLLSWTFSGRRPRPSRPADSPSPPSR
jgi:signal peptidase II